MIGVKFRNKLQPQSPIVLILGPKSSFSKKASLISCARRDIPFPRPCIIYAFGALEGVYREDSHQKYYYTFLRVQRNSAAEGAAKLPRGKAEIYGFCWRGFDLPRGCDETRTIDGDGLVGGKRDKLVLGKLTLRLVPQGKDFLKLFKWDSTVRMIKCFVYEENFFQTFVRLSWHRDISSRTSFKFTVMHEANVY